VGDFKLAVTASILLGSIPGVYIGSRLSASAPDIAVRPILVFVLIASALKLLNFSNTDLALALVFVAVTLPAVWGLIDASRWKPRHWAMAGHRRERWVWWLAIGLVPVGIGLAPSIAYFAKARPRLVATAEEDALRAEPSAEKPGADHLMTRTWGSIPAPQSGGD
jgi:hypothetical protein